MSEPRNLEQHYAIKMAALRHEHYALQVRASGLRRDARRRIEREMDELQRKANEVEEKIDDLRDAGNHVAAEVRAGVEMAIDDLRKGILSTKSALYANGR